MTPNYYPDMRPLLLTAALRYDKEWRGYPLSKDVVTRHLPEMGSNVDRVVIMGAAYDLHNFDDDSVLRAEFGQWQSLSKQQRFAIAHAIEDWKRQRRDRTVGIYMFSEASDPWHSDSHLPEHRIPLDLWDHLARRWWFQATDPWAAIGVDEFWLDMAAINVNKEMLLSLALDISWRNGIKIGVEAIKRKANGLGGDWEYLKDAPALGILNNFRLPDGALSNPTGWKVPVGYECHACIAPDDNVTAEEVAKLGELGFILSFRNKVFELPQ